MSSELHFGLARLPIASSANSRGVANSKKLCSAPPSFCDFIFNVDGMAEGDRPRAVLGPVFGDDPEKWTREHFMLDIEIQALIRRARSQDAPVENELKDTISAIAKKYPGATLDNLIKDDQPEGSIEEKEMAVTQE